MICMCTCIYGIGCRMGREGYPDTFCCCPKESGKNEEVQPTISLNMQRFSETIFSEATIGGIARGGLATVFCKKEKDRKKNIKRKRKHSNVLFKCCRGGPGFHS